MLKSNKNVFWEALLVTIVIFLFGFLIGFLFESSRIDDVNEYYTNSEISLMDLFALNDLMEINSSDCSQVVEFNLNFADRIFEEAYLMEKYSDANKIDTEQKTIHQRYDLMRTLLWINLAKIRGKCKNFHSIVYLYEYDQKDLAKKATQNVWSKILVDLKNKRGSEIILIPIAVDTEIISLQSFLTKFDINEYPAVIVDDKSVLNKIVSVQEIETYLN